jgi:hypothetical protein
MSSSVPHTRDRQSFTGTSFKSTPLEQVRTVIIAFVQGLFNAAPLNSYHWESEEERTEIIIRDENPIHVEKVGQRPALSFTLGNTQFYSVGMDDLIDYKFSSGQKTKGILAPGVMSINCCSRVDIEAHNLAWIIAEHIWLLRELLLRQGFFEIGRGINISPPSPAGSIVAGDSSDEWVCSTISVPWQFARTSAFTPLGRKIVENIETFLSTRAQQPVESKGWPSDPSGFPFNIHECPPASFAPQASDSRGGTPDPAGNKSNPLPRVPHPLNPSKTVVVRTVRPNRAGLRRSSSGRAPALPIDDQCVEKSEVAT